MIERLESLQIVVESVGTHFNNELACLSASLGSMAMEVVKLKRVMAQRPSSSLAIGARDVRPTMMRVRIPEPTTFGRVCCTNELENFLWVMEQYFRYAQVFKEERAPAVCDTKL